jgi:hypothetical protein
VAAFSDETKARGESIDVPLMRVGDQTLAVTGKWIKISVVRGEDWSEGPSVADPHLFIENLRGSGWKADIFTLRQFQSSVLKSGGKNDYHK